jgi:hypothetical protein
MVGKSKYGRAKKSSIVAYFTKENHCLESHGENIEVWPWRPRVKKTLMCIYFTKENRCFESLDQNIEIQPCWPRVKKTLSFHILYEGKPLSGEPWSEYQRMALEAQSQESIDFHILCKGKAVS